MTDGPTKPLTFAERMVCDCLARGWSCERTANECQIARKTVYVHVHNIAAKLPNPDGLSPYQLVFIWLQHRQWLIHRANEAA